MSSIPFIDCIEIVGSSVKEFEGSKKYINTGAINVNSIDLSQAENITFLDKPSRANLLADEGDLLFAKMQSTNKTVIIDQQSADYIFSTGFFAVRAKERVITKRCLYHLLKSDLFLIQKDKYCSGATQKAITNTGLKKIIVNIPPVEMQNGIANNFDQIDCLINLCSITLEKLDTLVKSRFVEMFGDTEINSNNFPVYKLNDLCTVSSSKRIYQEEQSSLGVPFLRISNLVELIDDNKFESELFIPEEKYAELLDNDLVPKANDILITSRGTLGKCYIIQENDKFYFQDGMISWLYNLDKCITPLYISLLFDTRDIKRQIENLQSGSTVAYLSIAMLKKLSIVVPPIDLQQQFADFVVQVDKQKAEVKKSLEKIETLKKSLMQEYFG